jgi:hypothetical protein
MIGYSSFLIEIMGVVVPVVLLVLGLGLWILRREKFGPIFVAFAGLMALMMGVRFAQQVKKHSILSGLAADQVSCVQIGKQTMSDPGDLSPIIAALNDNEWFSSNHGGWAEMVPLIITMKSSEEHHFQVAYYLKEEGAVIKFYRGHWQDGFAFSRKLPTALKEIGLALPSQR